MRPQTNTPSCTERTSPFFRLPPELRNRVYEHVLGDGGTVVVFDAFDYNGNAWRSRASTNHRFGLPKRPRTLTFDFPRQCKHKSAWETYRDASERKDSQRPYTVNLLLTCRQFHEEARSLPYFTNRFVMEATVASRFLRRRLRHQAFALRKLTLLVHYSFEICRAALKTLANLRSLELHIRLAGSEHELYQRGRQGLKQRYVRKAIAYLAQLQLDDFEVFVRLALDPGYDIRQQWAAWARGLEQMVLKDSRKKLPRMNPPRRRHQPRAARAESSQTVVHTRSSSRIVQGKN